MTYGYRILPLGLQTTADAAAAWFISEWGIKKGSVVVEEQFHPDVNFRPTFHVRLSDGHLLCIEVAEKIYDNTLDSVSLSCREKGLPVKLFVAVPKGVSDSDYAKRLRDAKLSGVGILEVDSVSGQIVQQALSFSLAGVRHIDLKDFPARFRQKLQHAHQVFRDGDPSKACSLIYDEIEGSFRSFAEKSAKKGLWVNPNLDISRAPWASLIGEIDRRLNRNSPFTNEIKPALLARMLGMTPHRNDAGHKIRDLRALIKHDKELRTRFEAAVDLLRDFLESAKKFRL